MEKQNRLGQWLKDRCEAEHLSYRGAAAKAGISHSAIKDIRNGKIPHQQTIIKLAEGFGGGTALLDHLLLLAGYRKEQPGEPSAAMAGLIDKVSGFNDRQIEMMNHFADFLRR